MKATRSSREARLIALALTILACVLTLPAVLAQARAERLNEEVQFSISAQSLATALVQFSKQARIQLVTSSVELGTQRTQGVNGRLPIAHALDALLDRTGLAYSLVGENTVAITALANSRSEATAVKGTNADLHVAQLAPDSSQSFAWPDEGSTETSEPSSLERIELEEIVVTGTNIHGSEPAGSKVIVIDREMIDRSGYARLEDLLVTLPQSFKGQSDEISVQRANNSNRGAEFQLRGLGPGTTLTLVNGRRQPAGGLSGAFTDISSIPLSAIERVEILSDGASAIYGSDAIGGVANIILRKDFDGAQSTARVASATGERGEVMLSQLGGVSWEGGNVLAGYQYSLNESLLASEREYTATDWDFRKFGGDDLRTLLRRFHGSPGTILCPAGRTDCSSGQAAYAIPPGQDGTSLTAADLLRDQANYTDTSGTPLLPRQELHAAFFSASQEVTDRLELFAEGRYGTRNMRLEGGPVTRTVQVPSSNPFYVNPFGGSRPVSVAYDFSKDVGPATQFATTDTYTVAAGGAARLGDGWRLKVDGSYAREDAQYHQRNLVLGASVNAALADSNRATALNVFGDGSGNNPATIDAIRHQEDFRGKSTNWFVSAIADGPILTVGDRTARLAIGTDYRDEAYRTINGVGDTSSSRSVTAVFAEFAVPVLGSETDGRSRLDLAVAARHEEYSDFGTSTNPKVGVTYRPSPAFALRATWGTAFRAPPFYQSDEGIAAPQAISQQMVDPKSATGSSKVIRLFGNNADLNEETATVWTAGFEVSPQALAGFSASLTYYSIDYKDKIQAGNPTLVLEDQWAALIRRDPSQAELDAICTNVPFVQGDCVGPIAAILDTRVRNIASVETDGLDLQAIYTHRTEVGEWSFQIGGNYTLKHEQAVTDTAPVFDVVGTVGNPVDLRFRAGLVWSLRSLSAGVTVNHSDDYRDVRTNPATRVDSWTTVDLGLAYRIDTPNSWFGGTRMSINATNLLDKLPPFVNSVDPSVGYDGGNASILGQVLSFQIVKDWQ